VVDEVEDRRVLQDAALVRRSRRTIDAAIAALAARPLDEAAADRMREALGGHASARQALRRLRLAVDTPLAAGAEGVPVVALDVDDAPPRTIQASPGQDVPRQQSGEEGL
jgi:hypothetical protein